MQALSCRSVGAPWGAWATRLTSSLPVSSDTMVTGVLTFGPASCPGASTPTALGLPGIAESACGAAGMTAAMAVAAPRRCSNALSQPCGRATRGCMRCYMHEQDSIRVRAEHSIWNVTLRTGSLKLDCH